MVDVAGQLCLGCCGTRRGRDRLFAVTFNSRRHHHGHGDGHHGGIDA